MRSVHVTQAAFSVEGRCSNVAFSVCGFTCPDRQKNGEMDAQWNGKPLAYLEPRVIHWSHNQHKIYYPRLSLHKLTDLKRKFSKERGGYPFNDNLMLLNIQLRPPAYRTDHKLSIRVELAEPVLQFWRKFIHVDTLDYREKKVIFFLRCISRSAISRSSIIEMPDRCLYCHR